MLKGTTGLNLILKSTREWALQNRNLYHNVQVVVKEKNHQLEVIHSVHCGTENSNSYQALSTHSGNSSFSKLTGTFGTRRSMAFMKTLKKANNKNSKMI